ncbi:MAG: hypothetical protein AAFR21_17795 [Pseudomonadota bacterium]
MVVFRFIAWLFIALAIAFLGADAVSSLQESEPVIRTTAEVLGYFNIDAEAVADGAPNGVSQALGTVFGLPLWAVFGILGVILTLIFRPID